MAARFPLPKPPSIPDRLDALETATKHNARRIEEVDKRVPAERINDLEGSYADLVNKQRLSTQRLDDTLYGLGEKVMVLQDKLEEAHKKIESIDRDAHDRFDNIVRTIGSNHLEVREKLAAATGPNLKEGFDSLNRTIESQSREIDRLFESRRDMAKDLDGFNKWRLVAIAHVERVDSRVRTLEATPRPIPTPPFSYSESERRQSDRVFWFFLGFSAMAGLLAIANVIKPLVL